jgi:hypothetical protein
MTKIPSAHGRPDDFQTPKTALVPLLPFLKPEWTIWEPACGKGNLARGLAEEGYKTISTDILSGKDFRVHYPSIKFDCIITNPPFSMKDEFIERCYLLEKPFALLMPLTTFEGKKRQFMFRKHGIQVLFFNRRINFETPSGNGTGSWFMTAWFTYGLGLPAMTFWNEDMK